ncbi:RNA-binding protein [Methylocystis heyeri]|uniref:RNA-binding protein n=1 Tax=Methylocystis heyeri TaxID=391905 RepID=A0A6B8KD21_9HYPH|nr:RNA-binding protein [Methylocystis heyeri]QGM44323.1 RNA-binding protein [Methylocystis heyeri]
MANKSLFASIAGMLLPRADAQNHAGGPAYALTPRHKLAQLAATGSLNRTFYADARDQLDDVLLTALDVDPAFIAKTAIYARRRGYMKDMPALLVALLSTMETHDFSKAFPRVIDNGKMLRSFVQIMRSGAVGRKSMGSRPKRFVANWLERASDIEIMRASVGQDPSLADVIKMVHPKPGTREREALYGYLIGRPYDVSALPQIAQDFEAFKRNPSRTPPDVPFQMLTALPLTGEHWAAIGSKGGWQMLRMNLNTFARHGAFDVSWFPRKAAARLRDPAEIKRARVFPYQLMAAYAAADDKVPRMVREALQDAMEISISNVPRIDGRVVVCPDVSGSMSSPVTGYRKGATSGVRCIDVAGLVTAAFLRANPETRVLPFENDVVDVYLNPRDSVMTNAQRLASIGGGGTNCSAPLAKLVAERARVDLVVFISDNESWIDARYGGRGTATMEMWEKLKRRNPDAKLVCIDIQPYGTTQAAERADVLNIGGFSDSVFEMISAFAKDELDAGHWVGEIEKIDLG